MNHPLHGSQVGSARLDTTWSQPVRTRRGRRPARDRLREHSTARRPDPLAADRPAAARSRRADPGCTDRNEPARGHSRRPPAGHRQPGDRPAARSWSAAAAGDPAGRSAGADRELRCRGLRQLGDRGLHRGRLGRDGHAGARDPGGVPNPARGLRQRHHRRGGPRWLRRVCDLAPGGARGSEIRSTRAGAWSAQLDALGPLVI